MSMSCKAKSMKKPFLVRRALMVAVWAVAVCLSLPQVQAQFQLGAPNAFGEVIPLPGHINELIFDEARGQLYAANFSAGRVEIVSVATHQRIGAFLPNTSPSALSAMAMSADDQYLVVAETFVSAAITRHGLTVINLNDPADRRHFVLASDEQPLALAFGNDNLALVVTTTNMQLFNPVDGSLTLLFDYEFVDIPSASPAVSVPVPLATFPRELHSANATATRDHKYIYGTANAFVFSYDPVGRLGFLTIRGTDGLVEVPLFQQVSASDDGSYFMAGQILFDNRLTVRAETLEAPPDSDGLFGGHVIDDEIDTIYAAFDNPVGLGPGQQVGAILSVMDSDNLYVRERIRITEQLQGRLVLSDDGQHLYGVSESGLLYLPLQQLSETPQINVRAEDRQLLFEFDFCNQEPQTRTIRIDTNDGGPAEFSIRAVLPGTETVVPGITFEPHQGVAPAEVRMTVSAGVIGNTQGTAEFELRIISDAVNLVQPASIFVSVRDLDQKGIFHELPGRFVDLLVDPARNRFYVLDQQRFLVHFFDADSFRLLGSFRTGNTPTWMTFDNARNNLVIANAQSETLTFIDLNNATKFGDIRLPWRNLAEGLYPQSVATDNSGILIVARAPDAQGRITTYRLNEFRTPTTLGIFENVLDPETAAIATPNRAGIMLASAVGQTAFWEALTRQVVLSRNDYTDLGGPVGVGDDFFVVGTHVLNSSLVPQADFDDASFGQEPAGFVMLPDGTGVRTLSPTGGVDTGLIGRFDPRDPRRLLQPTRMVEAAQADTSFFPFVRTLGVLPNGQLVSFGTAGLLQFPEDYDAARRIPRITAIVNSANFKTDVGTGGLISIFGEDLAEVEATADTTPLPLSLGGTCVTSNGLSLPLLYVSPGQINAQMSFGLAGSVASIVRTAGGLSDIFITDVGISAPAVFSVQGPEEDLFKAVFRVENDLQLSTLSNPFRHQDTGVAFLTGLGPVTPLLLDGNPAPNTPLSTTQVVPSVTVGGAAAEVLYSGLTPGFVGLYQINFLIPWGAPLGLQVPVTISAGTVTETFFIRIVEE